MFFNLEKMIQVLAKFAQYTYLSDGGRDLELEFKL